MTITQDNKTMLTDLYQLTMNAAYFDNQKDDTATFELFVRKLPTDWGYLVAAGIEDAIDYATSIHFKEEDIAFLASKNLFSPKYLDSLRSFRFTGTIVAVKEGTPVTANTPIIQVTAPRSQAQLLESALLNMINYQTLAASKASRVVNAASPGGVVEFGLRRAQEEDAAVKGSRAAYIGGAVATSNVKAGQLYDIPISGTHAHSFVMSFPSEIDAFRAYVKTFQNSPTLLIDTYNTINGARNAITVAKELEQKGKRLGAVRIDSGDLAADSRTVRKLLDEKALNYVKIIASNDLNEYKIEEMRKRGACFDAYGVGTDMITARPVAALPGVYKLVDDDGGPKMKFSEEKQTYPGKKQVFRHEADGRYTHDMLALSDEPSAGVLLLETVVQYGKRISPRKNAAEIRAYSIAEVAKIPDRFKEVRATTYPLEISGGLLGLVQKLSEQQREGSTAAKARSINHTYEPVEVSA